MFKIASPTDLQTELRSILAYADSAHPSRVKLAEDLQLLADRVAGKKPKGDFMLVRQHGLDDTVISGHKTKAEAEKAMRKHGGEPNSLDTNGLKVLDMKHWELVEVSGKWTVRPKK